jgi:transposase-like protein
MHVIRCRKLVNTPPVLDKDGVIIDDGGPKDIVLTRERERAVAELFMRNVMKNVEKEKDAWKFWIDEEPSARPALPQG